MRVSGQLHAPAAYFLGKLPGVILLGGGVYPRAGLVAMEKNVLSSC
jgi:hypothetical protein